MMPTRPKPQHSFIRLTALLVVFAGAIWVILNRQFVIDQSTVWDYKPSADIASIASRAQLSDKGKFYFYASRPAIDGRSAFNTHCQQLIEKTAILGCYVDRQIYIFNITDRRLDGIREVTAAHEMLHAAYDRLSDSERKRLDSLIETHAKNISDDKLTRRLALYDRTEPGERLNELHSILGTEITSLSPELEAHYHQYFTDRARLVALSNQYETVFQQIEDRQTTLIAELNDLADRVDRESNAYETALNDLKDDIADFNRRAETGTFSSQSMFTTERTALIARQSALQRQRTSINEMISIYNQKNTELDSLNTTAEGLQRSINAALPEAPSL